jgi:hypothetical protein
MHFFDPFRNFVIKIVLVMYIWAFFKL